MNKKFDTKFEALEFQEKAFTFFKDKDYGAIFYEQGLGKTKIAIMCKIDGQDVSVPIDSANRHYIAIQEWVADGNKIEDAD